MDVHSPYMLTSPRQPMQKQLQRHLLAFVPGAKIESVRYRSVAFKKPTAELPTDATPGGKAKKPAREHTRDRTATWRADNPNDDEDAEPRKAFLMPNEKKRIAFIKHEIHEHVDAVNAYVVFAHPPPPGSHPANLPPAGSSDGPACGCGGVRGEGRREHFRGAHAPRRSR